MNIRGGDFRHMNQPAILVYTNMCPVTEVPGAAIFHLMNLRIMLLFRFFVEDGAAIMVGGKRKIPLKSGLFNYATNICILFKATPKLLNHLVRMKLPVRIRVAVTMKFREVSMLSLMDHYVIHEA